MSNWALPSGYLNTTSVSLSRQITAASGLPTLSSNSPLSYCGSASSVLQLWAYVVMLSLLYVHHTVWSRASSSVQEWVCTVCKNDQPEEGTAHDDFTRGEERRGEDTERDGTRDGKDISSRLSRASSHFPLLAYCQSDHKQMGVTWAGNKLLINNYLNEGKCTDVTPLCPASTYFPTPLLSPRFRIFCKTFTAQTLDLQYRPVDA